MQTIAPRVPIIGIIAAVLIVLPSASKADVIVFDDTYGSAWTKGTWDMSIDGTYAYSGEYSVRRDGDLVFDIISSDGLDISETPILQAYVNFLVTDESPGHSLTNVKIFTLDGTLFEFDDRSDGWTCYLEGVEYVDAAEIVFDTNPETWQLFEIDLSQVDYSGWPYKSQLIDATPVTALTFSADGSSTSDIDMLADNVRFVPVVPLPTTLALLGTGTLLLLKRPSHKDSIGRIHIRSATIAKKRTELDGIGVSESAGSIDGKGSGTNAINLSHKCL